MECCQCVGIEDEFDEKEAARDLKRYHENGPDRTTQILLDAIQSEGVEGMSLLDVGGGVGVIQHELLKDGVRSAISVDASRSYLNTAKQEAERQGHADRATYVHGDFVELADGIPEVDIVTLDRVICCFDDMKSLVSRSTARTLKLYGVVYPRDNWLGKALLVIENLYYRLKRSQFRGFVHATAAVDGLIRSSGLKPLFHHKTLIWQVVLYCR